MTKKDDKDSSKDFLNDAWSIYKKTIKPLKPSKKKPDLDLQKKIELTIKERAPITPDLKPSFAPPKSIHKQKQSGSLSYKSTKKIQRTIQIQARLDLHGMTQVEAIESLIPFIHRCYKSNKKDTLVITGKGIKLEAGKTQGGILRRQLPLWLEHSDLSPYIHFYTNSHPFEGGTGAYYVRLKNKRLVKL